jgi:hypothetical protein
MVAIVVWPRSMSPALNASAQTSAKSEPQQSNVSNSQQQTNVSIGISVNGIDSTDVTRTEKSRGEISDDRSNESPKRNLAAATATPSLTITTPTPGPPTKSYCVRSGVQIQGTVRGQLPVADTAFLLVKNPRPFPNPTLVYVQKMITPTVDGKFNTIATGHYPDTGYEAEIFIPQTAEEYDFFFHWMNSGDATEGRGENQIPRGRRVAGPIFRTSSGPDCVKG